MYTRFTDTQLVTFMSSAISDIWRDRDIIRAQLDQYNIVFLVSDRRVDDGQSAQLARRLGMDASNARPFFIVSKRDMQNAADRDEEDEDEESGAMVEASDRRRLTNAHAIDPSKNQPLPPDRSTCVNLSAALLWAAQPATAAASSPGR